MVDFPDAVQAGEFGGLIGLFGDCALEVRIVDVLRESAGDLLGFGWCDDPAPTVVGGRGFQDGTSKPGECLEVFQITANASADLKFFGFVGGAGEGIKAVSGEEPHERSGGTPSSLGLKFAEK